MNKVIKHAITGAGFAVVITDGTKAATQEYDVTDGEISLYDETTFETEAEALVFWDKAYL